MAASFFQSKTNFSYLDLMVSSTMQSHFLSHSLNPSLFLKVTSCSLPQLMFYPRCLSTCSGPCSVPHRSPPTTGCCWDVWLLRSVPSTSSWPVCLPSATTLPECPAEAPTPARSENTRTILLPILDCGCLVEFKTMTLDFCHSYLKHSMSVVSLFVII